MIRANGAKVACPRARREPRHVGEGPREAFEGTLDRIWKEEHVSAMSVEGKENQINASSLRAELKEWENTFKQAHGRKAGRDDIKKNADISAKYKLYNDLTRAPKKQAALTTTPRKNSTRPPAAPIQEFQSKQATPRRRTPLRHKPSLLQPSDLLSPLPEVEEEPTPQWVRAALGPTPQRDGHVLGLFDGDDDDDGVQETPLKSGKDLAGEHFIAGTPSKGTGSAEHVHMKSPESSNSKRFMFAAFVGTPMKRKRDNNDIGTTSSSKRKYATPSFLRRCNPMARIDEDDDNAHEPVSRAPFQRRGLVRSLSTIIRNLKKQEEKKMDDEWDIMDELEAEERGETVQKTRGTPEVQVEDSQAVEMPLGPDQGSESSDENSAPEPGMPARKPWKKKGLKRQTRRTNMRPVLHKARKEGDEVPAESEDEAEKVIETQLQNEPAQDGDGLAEGADDGSDADQAVKKSSTSRTKLTKKKVPSKETDQGDGKKKPRKVNAEAHANYRRLNIKNKNSKAKGRGRFGKR